MTDPHGQVIKMKSLARKAVTYAAGGWFVSALSLLTVLMLFQGWLNAVSDPSLFDKIVCRIALFYVALPLSCVLGSVLIVWGGRLFRDAGHEYIFWLTILLQPSILLAAYIYQSYEDMRWDMWRYAENCFHVILIGLSGYIPPFLQVWAVCYRFRGRISPIRSQEDETN